MVANEDLKAERAVVYEGGVETKPLADLSIKASGYRAEAKDLVSIQTIGPWLYEAQNVDKTRRQGVEAEIKYQLPSFISSFICGTDKESGLAVTGGWELNRIQDRLTGKIIQGNGAARTAYNAGLDYRYTNFNFNLKGNYRFWNEAVTSNPKDRRFIWDAAVNYEDRKSVV